MKKLPLWKILFVLLFVCIFCSLFVFLYSETTSQPSKNWSSALTIDSYHTKNDFETIMAKNSFAVPASENSFFNIYCKNNSLFIKEYDFFGKELSSKTQMFPVDLFALSGHTQNNLLTLYSLTKDKNTIIKTLFNSKTLKKQSQKEIKTNGMSVALSTHHTTLFDKNHLRFIDDELDKTLVFPSSVSVLEAQSMRLKDRVIFGVIATNRGKNTFWFVQTPLNGNKSETVFTKISDLPSQSVIRPVSVNIGYEQEILTMASTLRNVRTGDSLVDFFSFSLSAPSQHSHKQKQINTYVAAPYFFNSPSGNLFYILNTWEKSFGRTEIAKGNQDYPNLYKFSSEENTPEQLTKTDRYSLNPSLFFAQNDAYLIHNEQVENKNVVMMSTTSSKGIQHIKRTLRHTTFDVFMTTITTYPALIFASIPPILTIIFPLLILILPIFMFRLNWVEQNQKMIKYLVILILTLSKIYTYGFSIFPLYTKKGVWPFFLHTPLLQWLFFAFISLWTIGIYALYERHPKHEHQHFFKAMIFYTIIDVIAFSTFFMPYALI